MRTSRIVQTIRLLSDVTLKNAKLIIGELYPEIFTDNYNWTLKDLTIEFGCPCKCLQEKYLSFEFFFFTDDIIVSVDIDSNFDINFWNKNKIICLEKAKKIKYRLWI